MTLWVVAAVLAVGGTTAAVTVANATGGRDEILSQDEVSRQLGQATATPATPGPAGTPSTPDPAGTPSAPGTAGTPSTPDAGRTSAPPAAGDGPLRTLRSRAGQVAARCDGTLAYLEAWSPNPGYRVDEVVRGPAPEASVWIESDSFEDVLVLVRCEAGEPVLTEQVEPDDHD
jgi:hypothetical protein